MIRNQQHLCKVKADDAEMLLIFMLNEGFLAANKSMWNYH
ncbi:hypothetical protein HMPREF9999_01167 [Alloprevotella sp. oral taxon 473 str. F0040]|nr:hypothetical protein HMPREF9999_01167 [Alloprevotella sp. oral taxon 473 str. F0040]